MTTLRTLLQELRDAQNSHARDQLTVGMSVATVDRIVALVEAAQRSLDKEGVAGDDELRAALAPFVDLDL